MTWNVHEAKDAVLLRHPFVDSTRVGKFVHILRRLPHPDGRPWQAGDGMPYFEVRIPGEEPRPGSVYPAYPGDALGEYVPKPLAPPAIYIAGPFTAPTPAEVRDNIRRAAQLGHEARKLGCYVLVPHLIGAPYIHAAACAELADDFGYRWWIQETLVWMRKCDGVLMTPDWERSNGARGERDDARGRGQPVFLSLEQLKDWLGARR